MYCCTASKNKLYIISLNYVKGLISMFDNIVKFAENSQTLKEARMNVEDISPVKEICLFILLFVLLILIHMFVSIILTIIIPITNATQSILILLFSFFVIPIVVYVYINIIEKRSWRSIGFSKNNAISSTVKGLLIGFLMFSGVVFISLLSSQFSYDGHSFSSISYIILFIIAFLIQSFAEEIYTRGWAMTYFSKRHSVITASIISAFLFVVPHLTNDGIDLLSILNIFLFGILFAVLYWRFDNIWVCGGVHSAWNISQGLLYGFNVSGIPTPSLFKFTQIGNSLVNGGSFGPESSLIATIVIVITLTLAIYYRK